MSAGYHNRLGSLVKSRCFLIVLFAMGIILIEIKAVYVICFTVLAAIETVLKGDPPKVSQDVSVMEPLTTYFLSP